MRFGDLATTVARYVADVEKLADKEREDSEKAQALIDDGAFRLAADPGPAARAAPRPPATCPGSTFSCCARPRRA